MTLEAFLKEWVLLRSAGVRPRTVESYESLIRLHIGPAIGEGHAVGKALEGMARQPETAGILRTNMILGCAITESTGIYSLVLALLMLFVF